MAIISSSTQYYIEVYLCVCIMVWQIISILGTFTLCMYLGIVAVFRNYAIKTNELPTNLIQVRDCIAELQFFLLSIMVLLHLLLSTMIPAYNPKCQDGRHYTSPKLLCDLTHRFFCLLVK